MELKDFYYSLEQEKVFLQNSGRCWGRSRATLCYFQGRRYTECVPHGEKPSLFPDMVLVGTGTLDDCSYET